MLHTRFKIYDGTAFLPRFWSSPLTRTNESSTGLISGPEFPPKIIQANLVPTKRPFNCLGPFSHAPQQRPTQQHHPFYSLPSIPSAELGKALAFPVIGPNESLILHSIETWLVFAPSQPKHHLPVAFP
ncbi:uncharacterized protein VTP21DRAFT_10159 [Calcarisporiella thermophila]|uniref:uncharacterized protein n=1 Tax=Calcarisporiella thermophila TaxID=911321 RepID=UPI0037421A74